MRSQDFGTVDAGFFVGTWIDSCPKEGKFAIMLGADGRFTQQHLSGGGVNGFLGRAFAREASGIWTYESTGSGPTLTLYIGSFSGNLSAGNPLDKAVRLTDALAEMVGLSSKVCVGTVGDLGPNEFSYAVGRPWKCNERWRRHGSAFM